MALQKPGKLRDFFLLLCGYPISISSFLFHHLTPELTFPVSLFDFQPESNIFFLRNTTPVSVELRDFLRAVNDYDTI